MKNFDQLKIIIEKFLAYEPDSKHYSFILLDKGKNTSKDPFVEITLPILDPHNDRIQLYAQVTEEGMFFITDDGFIADEFALRQQPLLFRDKLEMLCKLDEFDKKMDDYFYMLSTLFNFLGCKMDFVRDDKKEILQ